MKLRASTHRAKKRERKVVLFFQCKVFKLILLALNAVRFLVCHCHDRPIGKKVNDLPAWRFDRIHHFEEAFVAECQPQVVGSDEYCAQDDGSHDFCLEMHLQCAFSSELATRILLIKLEPELKRCRNEPASVPFKCNILCRGVGLLFLFKFAVQ